MSKSVKFRLRYDSAFWLPLAEGVNSLNLAKAFLTCQHALPHRRRKIQQSKKMIRTWHQLVVRKETETVSFSPFFPLSPNLSLLAPSKPSWQPSIHPSTQASQRDRQQVFTSSNQLKQAGLFSFPAFPSLPPSPLPLIRRFPGDGRGRGRKATQATGKSQMYLCTARCCQSMAALLSLYLA